MTLGSGKAGTFSLDNVVISRGKSIVVSPPQNLSPAPSTTTTQTIAVGNPVVLAANASGYTSVVWQVEAAGATSFSPIPGASSATLNLGTAAASQSGNQYQAVFSNSVGSNTTGTIILNVPATGGNFTAPAPANPGNTQADVAAQQVVESEIQNDLLSAEDGGSLTFPASTTPYIFNTPLAVYSGTNIFGATPSPSSTGAAGTVSFNTHIQFNLSYTPGATSSTEGLPYGLSTNLPYGFEFVANQSATVGGQAITIAQAITVQGLDIISNWGIFDLRQGDQYWSINIEGNGLEYGGLSVEYSGNLIMGIFDSVPAQNLNISYNYFHDSQGGNEAFYTNGASSSSFDNNLFYNVLQGGKVDASGSNVSFNYNYGTLLYNPALEVNSHGASSDNLEIENNVFSSWWNLQPYSWGFSVVVTDASSGDWTTHVVNNYVNLALAQDHAPGANATTEGAAPLEIGAFPAVVQDNTFLSNCSRNTLISCGVGNSQVVGNVVAGGAPAGFQIELETDQNGNPLGQALDNQGNVVPDGNFEAAESALNTISGDYTAAALQHPVPQNLFAGPKYIPPD
jgi:hypothetical protein